MRFWKQSPTYDLLRVEDNEKSQSQTSLISHEPVRKSWKSHISTLLPWALSVFFASLALYEHVSRAQASSPSSLGSYATGWKTDFAASRSVIKLEQVRFTGAPAYYDNGTAFVPVPDPIEYNGDGPEVDQRWEELTKGRYIRITEEEAKEAWGDDPSQFWEPMANSYVAGFDMFHSLHCLNRIRKMKPEDLVQIQRDHNARAHHYHCLTQLRQYIMCAGDMTVVPTRYYPGLSRNYIDSNQLHTCRNFGDLRAWLWERYNGSTAVPPVDP